jgi:hypothetical protein
MAPFPWHRESPAPPQPSQPDDDPAAGWDAITAVFAAAYPDQEPMHFCPVLPRRLGGPDPLDGISVYRASTPVPHWHYVTYGYSDLYGDDDRCRIWPGESGLGMEMTLRLADPHALLVGATAPIWVVNLLQNLARHVFTSGTAIRAHHHLDAGGPIALDEPTQLTALAFLDDPISPPIRTPHGQVSFVQAVGITTAELSDIVAWNTDGVLSVIGQRWPFGLTVLDRPGLGDFPELRAQVRAGAAGTQPANLAVHDLDIAWTQSGIVIALSRATLTEVLAAAEPAFGAGRPLLLATPSGVLELIPQQSTDLPTRRPPESDEPGCLGLTGEGLRVLAQLCTQAGGDYRHHAIPNVTWRLRPT